MMRDGQGGGSARLRKMSRGDAVAGETARALDPLHPEGYPRRVLLLVTGLSPQIVTETLYALAVRREPPFVPTEVQLVTTALGREHALLNLLSDAPGWFGALLREYKLPAVRFDEGCIHVPMDGDGRPLEDIRTPEDNARVADIVTERVRVLTEDPATALHVSIAGGRKTMGFYAGYALSLYGRPQDRLSHVLVSPPYEGHPEFFYPTCRPRVIHTLDAERKPLDTSRAEVTLAEIPFVRLRHGLDERLLRGEGRFSEAVETAQRALGPVPVVIDPDGPAIEVGGLKVGLPPQLWAFYSWLARRRCGGKGPVVCPPDGVPDPGYAEEYLLEYEDTKGAIVADPQARRVTTEERLEKGMDKDFFMQCKSKLHRRLKDALGPEAAMRFGVRGLGGRPKRFELAVPAELLSWKGGV